MDHLHPVMVEALRGLAPETPREEAERVRIDIEHAAHREQIRYDMALQDQVQQAHLRGELA